MQRLQRLNLCSLEKRRRWADVILAYGIFNGRYDLPQDLFFTLPSCSHLRGHALLIWLFEKLFFSVRIVKPQNKVSPFVINSPSAVDFKNQQDACWETTFGMDEPL